MCTPHDYIYKEKVYFHNLFKKDYKRKFHHHVMFMNMCTSLMGWKSNFLSMRNASNHSILMRVYVLILIESHLFSTA